MPDGKGIFPAVTVAHGFGGSIHHGLESFAVSFAEAGFDAICLVAAFPLALILLAIAYLPFLFGCLSGARSANFIRPSAIPAVHHRPLTKSIPDCLAGNNSRGTKLAGSLWEAGG